MGVFKGKNLVQNDTETYFLVKERVLRYVNWFKNISYIRFTKKCAFEDVCLSYLSISVCCFPFTMKMIMCNKLISKYLQIIKQRFEESHVMSERLTMQYHAFLTIESTSTTTERMFSVTFIQYYCCDFFTTNIFDFVTFQKVKAKYGIILLFTIYLYS